MATIIENNYAIPLEKIRSTRILRHFFKFTIQDILVFLISLTGFIEVNVVGRLFASEILMLALLPFLVLSKGKRLTAHLPKMFIVLGLIWLSGQVATDLIRSTPFHDYTRGWAKIIFTLINFSVIYLLIANSSRRIFLYALGLVGCGLLGFYFNPGIYAADYPWKFGVGPPITLLVILVATWISDNKIKHRNIPILLIGFIGVFNIYMGFRGWGGLCLLTTFYLILQTRMQHSVNRVKLVRLRRIIMLCSMLVIGALMILKGYEYAASSGFFGETAKVKYTAQAGKLGLLIGGRTEILVSGLAVMESPVIGHGSWAKNWYYAKLINELRERWEYAPLGVNELGLIPTHSYLMGAWVEAGILGAVFWFWVLSLPIRTLIRLYLTKTHLFPLITFFTFAFIWGILFSPYGAQQRIIAPYYISVLMIFLSPHRPKGKIKIR